MLATKVEEQQPGLNATEARVQSARDDTAQAVVNLTDSTLQRNGMAASAVAIVILGVGACSVGGAAAGGCVLCAGVRLVMTASGLAVTFGTDAALKKWQRSALESMTAHLP